ncbi:hypothetical protein [Streptomyces maremycinicus]|uniref:hypothetical protein n=1 Tax=Streptomyces maremycinicus TaxID=1679753 RepID=UPI00099BEB85
MPRDSALNRELHGEAADWSVSDHLLAAAVDHLAAANWMFACVNSEEGEQPDAPVPVPRPADLAGNGGQDDGEYEERGEYQEYEKSGERSGGGGRSASGPGPSTDGSRASSPDEAPSASQLARFFG